MRVKQKTIYFKGFRFLLTFPAQCEIWIEKNTVKLFLNNQTTTVILDPIKPEVTGNIPVAIRTPYNFSLIHKP